METRRIWKFPIKVTDEQHISIPKYPEFLSVQFQGDELCIWAVVEPENEKKKHRIRVVGTGHPLPEGCIYIGTVQDRPYVWHVFEG